MSLAILAIGSLQGCASPFDTDDSRLWLKHDRSEWKLTESGSLHHRTSLRSGPRQTSDAPLHDDLSSDAGAGSYVMIALTNSPAVRAAERRIQRLGARVPQVTSLNDPMFQIAPFGEMAETAAGQVGLMTGVSQRLPFPGKLDTRGKVAEQDVAMAVADLQQTRLRVIADTRRAYWSYYFATRALETTRRSRELLGQFKQIAEAEYKAGNRTQPDVLRASVELANLDNELITFQQRQDTSRGMLNQLMDRPVDGPLPLPNAVTIDHIDASLYDLLGVAAQNNPGIQKVRERIEQFRQRQKLARLDRLPDLTVSANYNAVDDNGLSGVANGEDQWWFGFGINLPIWTEKYAAGEREAMQGLLEGVAELTAEQNRIAFQVQDGYLKVEAQQKLVELFNDVIIPTARQTVEASSSGYRAGTVDFLTLVDNWRKLLNFELMHHRALTDMEQAVADLERAVGLRVPRTASADDDPSEQSPPDSQDDKEHGNE